jgi:hypothetical protein
MFDAGKLAHKTEDTPERIKEEYTPKSIEEEFEDAEILSIASGDDLDAIDDMKELRRIADGIGAPYKVSKKDQREAIREHKEMSE